MVPVPYVSALDKLIVNPGNVLFTPVDEDEIVNVPLDVILTGTLVKLVS
jgi:hypothetical protein